MKLNSVIPENPTPRPELAVLSSRAGLCPVPERKLLRRIFSFPESTDQLLSLPVSCFWNPLVSKTGCALDSPGAFVKM